MTRAQGRLRPFEAEAVLQTFSLQSELHRHGDQLEICYRLLGPIEAVVLPDLAATPSRLDALWQHTCFECFFAIEAQRSYREVNLSPSGDWNIYRFADYRQGLEADQAFEPLAISSHRGAEGFAMDVRLDLARLIGADQTLEIAVAAVIKLRSGVLSHWSLVHPAPAPDFHHRGGFVLRL